LADIRNPPVRASILALFCAVPIAGTNYTTSAKSGRASTNQRSPRYSASFSRWCDRDPRWLTPPREKGARDVRLPEPAT
jgi:hypothetical protein